MFSPTPVVVIPVRSFVSYIFEWTVPVPNQKFGNQQLSRPISQWPVVRQKCSGETNTNYEGIVHTGVKFRARQVCGGGGRENMSSVIFWQSLVKNIWRRALATRSSVGNPRSASTLTYRVTWSELVSGRLLDYDFASPTLSICLNWNKDHSLEMIGATQCFFFAEHQTSVTIWCSSSENKMRLRVEN